LSERCRLEFCGWIGCGRETSVEGQGIEGWFLKQQPSSCPLSPETCVETFELRKRDGVFRQVDVADAGKSQSWLIPRREVEFASAGAVESMKRIHALAVHLPATGNGISTRLIPGTNEVALCFRGLFGRWSKEGIAFGLGDARDRLTAKNEPALDRLRRRLDAHRSILAESGRTSAKETLIVTVISPECESIRGRRWPGWLCQHSSFISRSRQS